MAATTVQVQMQQRRDTAAGWTSADPTLLSGEFGLETGTNKLKVGDGSTAWSSLSYVPGFSVTNYPLVEADIADGAITTQKILDGTIRNADIYQYAAIQVSKLQGGGYPRLLIQTDITGNWVEWTNNLYVPGTLEVEGAATFQHTATFENTVTFEQAVTAEDNVTVVGDLTVQGVLTSTTASAFTSNPQTLTADATVPANTNAVIFGPSYTIDTGVTLTVSTGSFLRIL